MGFGKVRKKKNHQLQLKLRRRKKSLYKNEIRVIIIYVFHKCLTGPS